MAKSSTELLESMIQYLSTNTNFKDLDKQEGSVLRDVVLDSVARQLSKVYDDIDSYGALVFFVDNAENISEEDMDSIAKNFGLTRITEMKATNEVTFRKRNKPDSDINIGGIDGSGGVIVTTKEFADGSVIQFITTETVILTANSVQNSISGYYEVTAPIEAVVAGTSGNVAAGTITKLEDAITGIDTIYNYIPTTGGTALETNTSLATRIVDSITGVSKVNNSGYKSTSKNNFSSAIDALIIDPNNSESVRGPGTIDIYIYGKEISGYSEIIEYTGETEYTLSKKPVNEITSLVATVSGSLTTLVEGVDYEFIKDESSIYSYSCRSLDKIKFKDLGTKPDASTSFTVIYSYNKLISDMQDYFELVENENLCTDVLIRETVGIKLDISSEVAFYSGNSNRIETLKENIITALTTYLESLGLAASFSQSDIVVKARAAVAEIDDISLPFIKFGLRGATSVSDKITLSSKQYVEVDSSTFTITAL